MPVAPLRFRASWWLMLGLLAACSADCDPRLPRFARILDAGSEDGGPVDAARDGGSSSEEGGRDAGDAGEERDAGN